MKKLLIYVASPLRASSPEEAERNINYAKQVSRNVIALGHVPIAPHLLYPQFLDDAKDNERQLGIDAGIEILSRCDQLWAFADYGISEGMKAEIAKAKDLGKKVLKLTEGKAEECV